jgi:PIN domain nuclease of toxin-antitoxin system
MVSDPERLSRRARTLVESTTHELFLSAASAWEIAIKHGLGKLELPSAPAEFVPAQLRETGVHPLPIRHTHALRVADLPRHHRDPFDRLLVAQALDEDLSILSADRVFDRYDVKRVWS